MYNAEAYIERCLYSLINQNIPEKEYEILVYNDGSDDGSLKIVENIAVLHSNVTIKSRKNLGVIATRNELISLAKGSYIYFVDADDYVAYNSLGGLLEVALQNDLDLVGFETVITNVVDKLELEVAEKIPSSLNIIEGRDFLANHRNMRYEIWWYFIRKDFLLSNQLLFDKVGYDGDVVFTLKVFGGAKKVFFSPKPIYRYFQSDESTMRSNNDFNNKRIINYHLFLIADFSNYINLIKHKTCQFNKQIVNNLTFRRDAFTVFTIIKMVKNGLGLEDFNVEIKKLKEVGAYPIHNFIGPEYNSLCYKTLNFIINKESLISPIVYLRNLSMKTINMITLKKITIEA